MCQQQQQPNNPQPEEIDDDMALFQGILNELPNPDGDDVDHFALIHELFPNGELTDELGRAGYREVQVVYDNYQHNDQGGVSVFNLSMLAPEEAQNEAEIRQQLGRIITGIPVYHGVTWRLLAFVMRVEAQRITGQFAVSPFRVRQ